MKWKKRPSVIFLFLTLLHCALCNHHSNDKHGEKKDDTAIPGLAISRLEDLSFLDPYNLIDGKSFSSKEKASILHEIIPTGNNKYALHKKDKARTKQTDSGLNQSQRYVTGNLKDPENSTSLSSKHNLQTNYPNRGQKLPSFDDFDKTWSNSNKEEGVEDDLDYDDMKDFGENLNGVSKKSRDFKKNKPPYTRVEGDRNVLLQEAVRKLLGFSASPDPWTKKGRYLPDPTKEKRLPRYVSDLYERFQSGEMNAGLHSGNTVRSIHTHLGTVEGESMFLFNLSSLRPSEQLLNAEIHLYKRKLRPWVKRLEVEVVLYHVAQHYISEAGKITIRDTDPGWQWYDVTGAVRDCLAIRDPRPQLFGLSFRKRKPNGKTKFVPLKKFGRHHSMPFLVVYSNETEAVNLDQLDVLADRLRFKDDVVSPRGNDDFVGAVDEYVTNDFGAASEGESDSSSSEKTNDKDTKYSVHNQDLDSSMEVVVTTVNGGDRYKSVVSDRVKHRQKRNIFTNEIPEDPADFEKYNNKYTIPKTHPGILKARKDSQTELDRSSLIPFPDHHLQQRKRRRKNRRRKHRRRFPKRGRRLNFPEELENIQESQMAKDKSENSNICGRRKLVVDFADIGWGDWIISPKSFEAHYCAGECPFPLTKRLHPSNHATIQSIVHAIGIYDKVPAPCCVPDVMSSVTLLYFDEDRNVVLKNYPGMTVESCACR